MSRTIPPINTPRLLLRAMRAEDFTRFAQIWATPQVVQHITGAPRPKSKSWDQFLRNVGHWQIVGFGYWAVDLHDQAEIAGQVGFSFNARGLGEDFDPFPEAGWVLHPDAQGQGIGFEAAKAAHEWFDRVVSGRTVCMITPDNQPSIKVAEALGYEPLRLVQIDGVDVQLLTRKGPPV